MKMLTQLLFSEADVDDEDTINFKQWEQADCGVTRAFLVTVRAGTAYRHLFSKVNKKNYL